MGLREQNVMVGFRARPVKRNVYDIRKQQEAEIETGYVNFNDEKIPVWRPMDAPEGHVWRQIYRHKMIQVSDVKTIQYETTLWGTDGRELRLPRVEVELNGYLQDHLSKKGLANPARLPE